MVLFVCKCLQTNDELICVQSFENFVNKEDIVNLRLTMQYNKYKGDNIVW